MATIHKVLMTICELEVIPIPFLKKIYLFVWFLTFLCKSDHQEIFTKTPFLRGQRPLTFAFGVMTIYEVVP